MDGWMFYLEDLAVAFKSIRDGAVWVDWVRLETHRKSSLTSQFQSGLGAHSWKSLQGYVISNMTMTMDGNPSYRNTLKVTCQRRVARALKKLRAFESCWAGESLSLQQYNNAKHTALPMTIFLAIYSSFYPNTILRDKKRKGQVYWGQG